MSYQLERLPFQVQDPCAGRFSLTYPDHHIVVSVVQAVDRVRFDLCLHGPHFGPGALHIAASTSFEPPNDFIFHPKDSTNDLAALWPTQFQGDYQKDLQTVLSPCTDHPDWPLITFLALLKKHIRLSYEISFLATHATTPDFLLGMETQLLVIEENLKRFASRQFFVALLMHPCPQVRQSAVRHLYLLSAAE